MSRFQASLVVIAAITVLVVSIIYFWPRSDSKEQEARRILENVIRPELLPSKYSIANGSEQHAFLGFGRNYADHFFINWRINKTYFNAIFGYDKTSPHSLIGYVIHVWVKDPQESGVELSRKIFNSLPDAGWKYAGPQDLGCANTSISCVLWNLDSDKGFVETIRLTYKKPEIYYMPEEELVQDVVHIRYLCIKPLNQNPVYNDMEEFQENELWLWGGG